MILQIVETGFPANSDTSTQHTCFQLPVYVFRRSQSCVLQCIVSPHYWAIIVKVSAASGILIYLTWQERDWGLRVRGGSQKQQQPSLGSALQLPQLEKGLDRLISGTVQLSQLGTQLFFLISVKIRCTFPEAGKLTTLDRLKKWMDGPEQDLQHPIYPALLMWTQSVLPEVLAASPEVSQTDTSLPYQARFLCSSGSYRFLWYWYYWTTNIIYNKKNWFIVMECKARFLCPFCWYTLTKSVLLLSTTLLYIHYESGAEVFIWIDKKLSTNLLYIHYGSGAEFVLFFK